MLNNLIGNIKNGRLIRLQYLGYFVLLNFMIFFFAFGTILAIGAGEHIIGGNLQEAQAQLREWFTLPFILVFALFMIVFSFMNLNIMAKRIRDIGLPGWWSILVILILEAIISFVVSQQASSGIHSLVWLLLVLVPSNSLGKK